MPSFGDVQLPQGPVNMLAPYFDAQTGQQKVEANALANMGSQQDLTDRATLRAQAAGLATRDPVAQANAAVLPNGANSVSALSNADAQTAASKLALLQYSNSIPTLSGNPQSGGPPASVPGGSMSGADGDIESQLQRGENPSGISSTVNKQGYSGNFQFGTGRLTDLGMYQPAPGENPNSNQWTGSFNIPGFPQVKTYQDFLQSAPAQQAAMHVHVANIRGAIADTPGADKLSPSGLIAVAHLGGIGGMQHFVQTQGAYNPSDANGTSLSNYYNKYSQAGLPALAADHGHPAGPLLTPPPAQQQVASAAGTAGMPQTANDASGDAPPPQGAPQGDPGLAMNGAINTLRMQQTDPEGTQQPSAMQPGQQNSLLSLAPDGRLVAPPQNALAPPPPSPAQAPAQPMQPTPQQPAAAVPQGGSGLPPGAQFFKVGPGGAAYYTQGLPAGMAMAKMPDGSTQAFPIPGTSQGVDIKDVGGTRSFYNKQTGALMRTEVIPNVARGIKIDTADGPQVYQPGTGMSGPLAPLNTRPEQQKQLEDDYKQIPTLASQARDQEAAIQKTLEARNAAANLPTGAGFDTRASVSNWLQTYAPGIAKALVGSDGGALPDAAQAQIATKLLAGQAQQNEKAMGGSGGLGITEMFLKQNPNPNMQPVGIRDMSNLNAVTAMASKDYLQGKINHIYDHGQQFTNVGNDGNPMAASPKGYVNAASYDRGWFNQNNANTYMGAINAMNGKPFAEWSKGLSPADAQRALGVVARIDPTVSVTGRNGHPLPVSQFVPQNPASGY